MNRKFLDEPKISRWVKISVDIKINPLYIVRNLFFYKFTIFVCVKKTQTTIALQRVN